MGPLPPLCAPDGWTALTAAAPGYNGGPWTCFAFLLPYLEQQNVYNRLVKGNISRSDTPPYAGGYCGGQFQTVIKTYLCPSDPSVNNGYCTTTYTGADSFAAGCYGANYYIFGNPNGDNDSWCVQGANALPRSIPDGLSNTLFFGEVYASCGLWGDASFAFGSLWADSTSKWRPIMCHNSVLKEAAARLCSVRTVPGRPQPFTQLRSQPRPVRPHRRHERRPRRRQRALRQPGHQPHGLGEGLRSARRQRPGDRW